MKSRCPEERHEDSEDSEDGIEDMIRHVDRKKAQVPTWVAYEIFLPSTEPDLEVS